MAATAIGLASEVAFAQSAPAMSRQAVEEGVATVAAQMAANPPSYPNATFLAAEARGLTLFVHLRFNERQETSNEAYSSQILASQCQSQALRQYTDIYGVVFDLSIDAVDGSGSYRFRIDRDACVRTTGVSLASNVDQNHPADNTAATLGDQELLAAAELVRAFTRRDAFEAPPTAPQFAGHEFSYELPVRARDGAGCGSLPHWGYSATSQELEVTFMAGMTTPLGASGGNDAILAQISENPAHSVHFLPIRCNRRELGSYRAENAFGARTQVYRSDESVVGVGHAAITSELGFTSLKVAMSPDDARTISRSLIIRVTGQIDEWLPGSTLACGRQIGHARFDHPWEDAVSACVYRATVFRIELLDGPGGRVLATHRPEQRAN